MTSSLSKARPSPLLRARLVRRACRHDRGNGKYDACDWLRRAAK